MNSTPTWQNTLRNNGWRVLTADDLNDLAIEAGYEFFIWEDKIYRCTDGFWVGKTVHDLGNPFTIYTTELFDNKS